MSDIQVSPNISGSIIPYLQYGSGGMNLVSGTQTTLIDANATAKNQLFENKGTWISNGKVVYFDGTTKTELAPGNNPLLFKNGVLFEDTVASTGKLYYFDGQQTTEVTDKALNDARLLPYIDRKQGLALWKQTDGKLAIFDGQTIKNLDGTNYSILNSGATYLSPTVLDLRPDRVAFRELLANRSFLNNVNVYYTDPTKQSLVLTNTTGDGINDAQAFTPNYVFSRDRFSPITKRYDGNLSIVSNVAAVRAVGNEIYYVTNDANNISQLYKSDGQSSPILVSDNKSATATINFKTGGEKVLFTAHDGNDVEVYVYSANTQTTRQLTNNNVNDTILFSGISPDGNAYYWFKNETTPSGVVKKGVLFNVVSDTFTEFSAADLPEPNSSFPEASFKFDSQNNLVYIGNIPSADRVVSFGSTVVQNLTGTSNSDTLQGGLGDDTLSGLDGNDTIYGFNGKDLISGGNGNDLLDGENGNDTVLGGAGLDTLYGGNGDDSLDGGDDSDRIFGGDNNDILQGGNGNDFLDGENDNDQLAGGAGNDTLYGADGNDTLLGAIDDDYLNGGFGEDSLVGGTGNDTLIGFNGNDSLIGDNGDDFLDGENGNDSLLAGAGNDSLYGGNGTDYLYGDNGNDRLVGGEDADTLYGALGNDFLDGENGNDSLIGGDGNDAIYGSSGNDFLFGGNNNDILDGGDGSDTLSGFDGLDTLTGGDGIDFFTSFAPNATSQDMITDFQVGIDKLVLNQSVFPALQVLNGSVLSFAVVNDASLIDISNSQLVYSSLDGTVTYNQNGAAAGLGTGGTFVKLENLPLLSVSDFQVIA
jgi:Ca2+-binding RTX toxin-like protein